MRQAIYVLAMSCVAGTALAGEMFWSVTGGTAADGVGIYRANLDGTGVTKISSTADVIDLDFDSATGTLVWATRDGRLITSDRDGADVSQIHQTAPGWGPSVGVHAGNVFFNYAANGAPADSASGIYRVGLDGSNLTQLTSGSGGAGLGINQSTGRIYWQNYVGAATGSAPLHSINADGTGETVNDGYEQAAFWGSLAIGQTTGDVYTTGEYWGLVALFRSDASGSSVSLVADIADSIFSHFENDIQVVESRDEIYTGLLLGSFDNRESSIVVSSLDGTGTTELLSFDGSIGGLAVVIPAPGTAGLLAIGALAFRRRR
ncbi:MAG: hypothetical protein DHS20C14_10350 [Phycisphaeraceae bacterium]|nr:MAG: hypothetical protein DHS20C14_10350 [Phycisphaeraceae bacterium]